MAQYISVEETLNRLELVNSYKELTAPAEDLKTICMCLRFLKSFLASATKLSPADNDLKYLLNRIQECVNFAGNIFPSLCVDEEEEESMGDKKQNPIVSEWLQEIKILTPTIRRYYISVIQSDAMVSDRCLVKMVNSVLRNIKDLIESNTSLNDSIKKQVEALEVKLRFLGNFVWFSLIGCIKHRKLADLLRLIESVAITAACLSFQCFFEDEIDDDMVEKMNAKLSQVLWTIEIIEPGLRDAYINGLKESPSSQLNRSSSIGNHELAMGYLQSSLNDLEELISRKSGVNPLVEDQLLNLREELKFLLVFLKDPPKLVDQDEGINRTNDLLAHTQAVARQTAPVIYLLLVSMNDQEATRKVDLYSLLHLLNKIDRIKEELKKADFSISKAMKSNFPKVSASELINFLLGTLNEVLNYKTDSVAFVGHQLGLVKAKLVCLNSLLCFGTHLEIMEATNVVHEAKHAIGSVIIRDIPLWQNMLQLSEVIKKIQNVNNRLAAVSVGEIVEIGVDTSAQDSDSSTLLALAPDLAPDMAPELDLDRMEVSIHKESEAAELKKKVTAGSMRLCLISIFVAPNRKDTIEYVYEEVSHQFPVHAWIYVRQKYQKRELMIDILENVATDLHGAVNNLNVTELENRLYNHLQSGQYLIVLNDEWGYGAWNDISSCFPNNNNGSRILLPGLPE